MNGYANHETESTAKEPMDPIDFILVWSGEDSYSISDKAIERRRIFESNLEKEGLILERDVIKSQKLNFLKVTATLEVLQRYAEILKIQMPIKRIPGFDVGKRHTFNISAQSISKMTNGCCGVDSNIFPERGSKVTTVYSRDKHYLFDINNDNIEDFFTPALRSRIVHFILKRKRYKASDDKDELAFGYERLIANNTYSSGYPLHDGDYKSLICQRGLLQRHWGSLRNCLKLQPLDAVKDYFGVKITIYYAWLGFYTRMLIAPSILGLICFIYGVITVESDQFTRDLCESDSQMCPLCDLSCDYWKLSSSCKHSKFTYMFDNDFTAAFAFMMSIWTAVYLEFWKRYCSELNYRWDLNGFDAKDQIPRPEFIAKMKNSNTKHFNYVTNTVEPAVPFWGMKLPYGLLSISSMLLLICVALAAVFGVIVYRISMLVELSSYAKDKPVILSYELMIVNVTAAFINLMFILMFSRVYRWIARSLTELELPRTQQDYEWSYAFKLYVLQFINHYSSIFYIAYIKGNFVGAPNRYIKLFGRWRQEECGMSCMPELCIQLAVIMIGKQFKNALLEMFIPCIRRTFRKARLKAGVGQEKVAVLQQQMTKDYELLDWDNETLTEEYLEMVIQYGFVTIFVAAFPLAPLFALINNVVEVRLDAQKILKYHKRPVSLRVKGIGVWYTIMDSLAKFAVLSNAFIIAVTSNFIPKLMYRFFVHNRDDPRYGTLNGFLNHTLTKFDTMDLDKPPKTEALKAAVGVCRYPTYRRNYNEMDQYQFTDYHWQLWLGRVLFVLAFENIVGVFFLFIRWAIPDVKSEIQDQINKEEFLTNELIIQQELLRARGVKSEAQCLRRLRSFEGVDNVDTQEPPRFTVRNPEQKRQDLDDGSEDN